MNSTVVIHDASKQQWLRFKNPVRIIETTDIGEVLSKFQQIEKSAKKENLYAVGFVAYEAAPAFDSALKAHSLRSLPLLWFALYSKPIVINLESVSSDGSFVNEWKPSVTQKEYNKAIARIKNYIREGDTYQVNYTMRLSSEFAGDQWGFFRELVQTQQADYAAFIDTEKFTICSASPELFFTFEKGKLTGRPMKGTAKRGLTLEDDKKQAEWLYNSEKNRAENLMIVDMIRNDFGRIAKSGSVKVPNLFTIEKYPTVWQMTSTVNAETFASLTDVMKAIFPCASITGAPKVHTMEIISELETKPRGVYTGTIGFISPQKRAQFNVAIRTVVIDKTTEKAEYGVGGGIVWDSTDQDEYDECKIKARVLTEKRPEFSLLESILWTPDDGYFLLDYHLKRLEDSAEYFDYCIDLWQVRKKLNGLIARFSDKPQKVRMLASKKGEINCEFAELDDVIQNGKVDNPSVISCPGSAGASPSTVDICRILEGEAPAEPGRCNTFSCGIELSNKDRPLKLTLADTPVNSASPFLYHKTTNREIYDSYRAKFPDYDDVILWNEKKEITESTIANLVVKIDGNLYTPSTKSGLLAGTFRQYLLDQGAIKEKIIHLDDLKKAEEIFFINSVRKWQQAVRR